MAPIRRYLRITKYSVLEVRIYLENPALADTWLLRSSNPALPRIIQAIRPVVLPKLREENERVRGKSKASKKNVKDVIAKEDFEVSIFLNKLSTRHSLLTKHKTFTEKPPLRSNSSKLTGPGHLGGASDKPISLEDAETGPVIALEEDGPIDLADIPEVIDEQVEAEDGDEDAAEVPRGLANPRSRRRTRQKPAPPIEVSDGDDTKDKLSLNTSYEGFSIYGHILCLIVKRRGGMALGSSVDSASLPGQQMLENWVSTQAALDEAGPVVIED